MKEIPVKQQPCIVCPIAKKWRLECECTICNYYKGSKNTQNGKVVICIANER